MTLLARALTVFVVWRLGKLEGGYLPVRLPLAIGGLLLLGLPGRFAPVWGNALGFALLLAFAVANARHRMLAALGVGALLHLAAWLAWGGPAAQALSVAGSAIIALCALVYLWRPALGQPQVAPVALEHSGWQ